MIPYENELLDGRREFCLNQLSRLRAEIPKIPDLADHSDLCIDVINQSLRFIMIALIRIPSLGTRYLQEEKTEVELMKLYGRRNFQLL